MDLIIQEGAPGHGPVAVVRGAKVSITAVLHMVLGGVPDEEIVSELGITEAEILELVKTHELDENGKASLIR